MATRINPILPTADDARSVEWYARYSGPGPAVHLGRCGRAVAAITGATLDDMPWALDFEVADPDGNRLRFAQAVDAQR